MPVGLSLDFVIVKDPLHSTLLPARSFGLGLGSLIGVYRHPTKLSARYPGGFFDITLGKLLRKQVQIHVVQSLGIRVAGFSFGIVSLLILFFLCDAIVQGEFDPILL